MAAQTETLLERIQKALWKAWIVKHLLLITQMTLPIFINTNCDYPLLVRTSWFNANLSCPTGTVGFLSMRIELLLKMSTGKINLSRKFINNCHFLPPSICERQFWLWVWRAQCEYAWQMWIVPYCSISIMSIEKLGKSIFLWNVRTQVGGV